jgi:hypothetical protein
MRQSVKRTGYLVVAVLLTLAGVVFATGTASADRESNSLIAPVRVQACAFPAPGNCPLDSPQQTIPANTEVFTFCVLNNFNLIYSGPNSGRGGFVNTSVLRQPTEQVEQCEPGSGGFGQVNSDDEELALFSCSGPCVNFGDVEFGDLVDVFCELSGSFLVYLDRTGRAGFLETSAVNTFGTVDDCNP